jgi:hypothetical protein
MNIKLTLFILVIAIIIFIIGAICFLHPISVPVVTHIQPKEISPNDVIQNFFLQYYHAYCTHASPDFSSMVDKNQDTILFLLQLDYRLALFDTFNDQYDAIKIQFDYYAAQFTPPELTTSVYVTATYHYHRDPPNVNSRCGTLVHLTLEPQNGTWMIIAIHPEDSEYDLFQSAITEQYALCDTLSTIESVEHYITHRIENLPSQRVQWDAFVTAYNEIADSLSTPEYTINFHALLFPYSGDAAANYGYTFGNVFDNGIFKRMENDCTNFISQCLWAGYGGTSGIDLSNTEQLKQRVKQNYRMVDLPDTHYDWWGLNADSPLAYPSPSFMRVMELWDFFLSNQSLGPKGIGYNNNQYYWQLEGTTIHRGDVLQFYSYAKSRYSHSVIVVSPESESYTSNSPWTIRVAQHTGDYNSRPLHQLIAVFSDVANNGNTRDCKMRLLKPLPGTFDDAH